MTGSKDNVFASQAKSPNSSVDTLGTDIAVNPSISYPSYMPFDEFIDVDRLRSLDGYISRRIRKRIERESDPKFYTGPYTLDSTRAGYSGARMVYLAESERPDSYFDLDRTELWRPTEHANEFALLMEFIRTLPFEATGRMLIMYDDAPREVTPHRDHVETDICHEFIWFRTNLRKPFFMLNQNTGEKSYVESYSAWFDSVNQYHGSDPCDGLAFSIRVDGKFTDEFRAHIPWPPVNQASAPSYWACARRRQAL